MKLPHQFWASGHRVVIEDVLGGEEGAEPVRVHRLVELSSTRSDDRPMFESVPNAPILEMIGLDLSEIIPAIAARHLSVDVSLSRPSVKETAIKVNHGDSAGAAATMLQNLAEDG